MKVRERKPIDLPAGTTLIKNYRFAVMVDGEKVYLTDEDIDSVLFRIRDASKSLVMSYPLVCTGDLWSVEIPATETQTWSDHRALYYVVDKIVVDRVSRYIEGPIRVSPYGGFGK
ncbi:hypothetical protein [Actinoplanes derwentensis]|uniref:Uncharacterized protein n=1 Tax=Actinoplanes derwentensis TaxID=113562 RepID=A0A1H1V4P5_9ACTN|nr:hypothetical protein [Actinoplanes derwentensis]GID89224.1 hypothetical protein Ade03nite_81480 [Actinoplanes derwentensis]SDS79692.1 hypothetical protein SAMN04489716_1639 [Actinoplanes derwentensis]